jgi:hypothetical protein
LAVESSEAQEATTNSKTAKYYYLFKARYYLAKAGSLDLEEL